MMNLNQEESDFSFPSRRHRIRKHRDFQAFFKSEGALSTGVVNTSFGWIRFRKNDLGYLRIAVSVSKKVSKKSTVRNRLKRVCSELLRLKKNDLKGYDIWVFIKFHTENVREELESAISKIYSM